MTLDLVAARASLEGLSVGDAFGQSSFGQDVQAMLQSGAPLPGPWPWTDDTAQAAALFQHIKEHGCVSLDPWALDLSAAYTADPSRGYGGSAHRVLRAIASGEPWRQASQALFSGQGSMGNGAAMRIAPLGAAMHGDLEQVREQALLSALPTHAHPEAGAGAVSVAIAAALVAQNTQLAGQSFLQETIAWTPLGETRTRLERAATLLPGCSVQHAATVLGNGMDMLTQHTVPFCLWIASKQLHDFETAMWQTVSAGGDRDTTCAIVGGVVGLRTPPPAEWIRRREAIFG